MEMPTITIALQEVYGTARAYPNCSRSRIFADMLETKTLTAAALRHIRELGYEIQVSKVLMLPEGDLRDAIGDAWLDPTDLPEGVCTLEDLRKWRAAKKAA